MGSDRLKELEKQLVTASGGVEGIDALNALAWELRELEPERSRNLAENALDLARTLNVDGQSNLRGTAQALITLGELSLSSDAYGLALRYDLEAYTLLQGRFLPELLAVATHSIGWAHYRLGNFIEAINFLEQSLNFYKGMKNPEKEAEVLTSLGSVSSGKGELSGAMEYFQQALALQQNSGGTRAQGVTHNNLAYTQIRLGFGDQAVINAQKALKIFRELGLLSVEARGLDTMGKAYLIAGNTAQAEEAFQQCLIISRRLDLPALEMEAMLNLGKMYQQQGQNENACRILLRGIRIAEKQKSYQYCYMYHEILSKIYEEMGDLKEALAHYQGFHTFMDLSLAESANYRLENLKTLHQVEKKRKETEVLWLHNRALEREIDDRRRERAELEILATTDPLTGLYNRRHFFTLGEYELEKSLNEDLPLCVILLDIDHFKQVNDRFGHAVGDQVLAAVAKSFSQNARQGDVCCRYGGEEFVILLPNANLANGKDIAERIRQAVSSEPFHIDGKEIVITTSLGVAQAGPEDNDLEGLLARADQALYRAKAVGRNRIST